MGTIIHVTSREVYIKEKAVYYKISKELFMFKPQVGYQIKVLKTYDNRVIKIILISKYDPEINKRNSSRFLRITGIYNIIIGGFLLVLISEKNPVLHEYFPSIFITIILIFISGILVASVKRPKMKFILATLTTAFYLMIVIVSIVMFFTNRASSAYILLGGSAVPLVFNTLYFLFNNKEGNSIPKRFPSID